MHNKLKGFVSCDLLIVGAGVTGAAQAYLAAKYSDIKHIIVIEKFADAGLVNSNHASNAQTLHEGDTETNYGLKKALKIKFAGKLVRQYLSKTITPDIYKVVSGMVIGVGKNECDKLRKRFAEFSPHYPKLEEIYADKISEVEPAVMSGRKLTRRDEICALYTPDRISVNYQMLAKEFLKDALAVTDKTVEVYYNTPLLQITPTDDKGYLVDTGGSIIHADVVEFAAGAYSLSFAQDLGYAENLAILNVAGNFYRIDRKINGKIYTEQYENIPFAAPHIDRNLVTGYGQLGPTTQIILLMIRRHYETFGDYMRTPLFSTISGYFSLFRTLKENHLLWYGIKNLMYAFLPILGKYLYLLVGRKIIPDLKWSELELIKDHGGSRPQIIDRNAANPLVMGDSNIVGTRAIFNTTPSPGASVCLKNALRDLQQIITFHDGTYNFDIERFKKDFDVTDDEIAAAYA